MSHDGLGLRQCQTSGNVRNKPFFGRGARAVFPLQQAISAEFIQHPCGIMLHVAAREYYISEG